MNVDGFGGDPFWLICLKVLGVFVLLVVIVLITIWAERRVVATVLRQTGGNLTAAAKILEISRPTLYTLLRQHGFDLDRV